MGVQVRQQGEMPSRAWDLTAARELALVARTVIVNRTFRQGRGITDAPHKPYSTRGPITISFESKTGKRLKPKGGLPAYGRGHPRRLLTAKGNARRAQGWKVTGRRYDNYGAYKAASRKGPGADNTSGVPKLPTSPSGGSAPVDLTLSGQLQREFVVKSVALDRIEIGLTGEATVYGSHVNAARPWIGLSPNDLKVVLQSLNEQGIVGPTGASRGIIGRAMDRARDRAANQKAGPR